MAEDRYIALKSAMGGGMNRKLLQSEFVKLKQPTFRDTVLELPNDMELGAFIREWINENPENGLNIKYLNTDKK
tara:strand:- start:23 stop:244 length:222 start_codon:yes stop_codon:yes gene_type:complete